MCLGCVCSLLCKLISFFLSLIIIVGIILIILWQTGVIFKEDGGNNSTLNSLLSGTAGH